MKSLLIVTLLIFSTSSLFSEDIKKSTDSNKVKTVSNNDFFAKFMAMKQKTKKLKAENKALDSLEKSVDELSTTTNNLSNTLGVDK